MVRGRDDSDLLSAQAERYGPLALSCAWARAASRCRFQSLSEMMPVGVGVFREQEDADTKHIRQT